MQKYMKLRNVQQSNPLICKKKYGRIITRIAGLDDFRLLKFPRTACIFEIEINMFWFFLCYKIIFNL